MLTGKFVIDSHPAASGGRYMHVPNGMGSADLIAGNPGQVRLCFSVTAPGRYRLRSRVYAASGMDDSFFVTVDGSPAAGYVWDVLRNTRYAYDYVHSRTSSTPVFVTLQPGDHLVTVYLREDGARLDKLELERVVPAPTGVTTAGL